MVEVKTVKDLNQQHYAAVLSYLRSVDRRRGLIINFAKTSLEVRHVLREYTADLFPGP